MAPSHPRRGLRIAMIGQKGLPATFGGIEHHVEELGARMAERGHQVTVFCRTNYGDGRRRGHRGMRLVELPTVGTKHLDAIVHSALATAVAMRGEFDILHYHAIGPGALAALPRVASRAKVVLTLHGLDEERAKWGRGARAVLKAAGWVSARAPNAIIAVSRDLQRHYREVRGRPTLYIPNGVCAPAPDPAGRVLDRFGLGAGGYLLFVGRLVPEKAPDLLVRAYRQVPGDHRLVLVGGSSFTGACTEQLRRLAAEDDRVVLADPEGERRGAAALRERVVRAYDWDEAAAATERVYRLLVDGSTVHAGRAAAIADHAVGGGGRVLRGVRGDR